MATDYVNTTEAARILHTSQRAIQRMIKAGKLNARTLDPNAKRVTYLISRADLARLARSPKR